MTIFVCQINPFKQNFVRDSNFLLAFCLNQSVSCRQRRHRRRRRFSRHHHRRRCCRLRRCCRRRRRRRRRRRLRTCK